MAPERLQIVWDEPPRTRNPWRKPAHFVSVTLTGGRAVLAELASAVAEIEAGEVVFPLGDDGLLRVLVSRRGLEVIPLADGFVVLGDREALGELATALRHCVDAYEDPEYHQHVELFDWAGPKQDLLGELTVALVGEAGAFSL